ncbi:TatD family hydrolase [Pelistega sp. MC2]|uniref:TatD family hydrolase n=1 Tax=Pelistega sp. MC2 TaxID=1720297 RepID=UPI0008D9EF1C|nr:TatD family hydrolase [Pelistega sp. MC2]
MLIDTHCHLDAPEFDSDRPDVIRDCQVSGVGAVIIPAVWRENFVTVKTLAHQFQGGYYALGIHPMYVRYAKDEDLQILDQTIEEALQAEDERLVAVGEIGLDYFVPEISSGLEKERQEFFYQQQVKMAKKYDLPVLLHVRRSQDRVLKYLRQYDVRKGIAHAFNGSEQQAKAYIEQGFCLGFGGTATFTRALQIRRLATELPIDSLVLETDAPDIPPAWLSKDNPRNSPAFLPQIAQVIANLRGITLAELYEQTAINAQRVLPRLKNHCHM